MALARLGEDQRNDGGGDLELLRLPPGLAIADAVRGLKGSREVEFAEPNWVYHHQATSNDPYFSNGSLWGMYGDTSSPANHYGSQAAEAWAAGKTNCGSVWAGIIDEGYMYTHDDLASNAGKTQARSRTTAKTTTATATWMTFTAGISPVTTTPFSMAAKTTTARTWRGPLAPSVATARAWPGCAGM